MCNISYDLRFDLWLLENTLPADIIFKSYSFSQWVKIALGFSLNNTDNFQPRVVGEVASCMHSWGRFGFMEFNATFNNISAISWRSVLLVEETGENHCPVASHWQTLSHKVVSTTRLHEQGLNSQLYVCTLVFLSIVCHHWYNSYFLLAELQQSCRRLMFWRKAGGWVGVRPGGRMLAYLR